MKPSNLSNGEVVTLLHTVMAELKGTREEMHRLVRELGRGDEEAHSSPIRRADDARPPKTRLPSREYGELMKRVRAVAKRYVPAGAAVAVISRGDSDLLAQIGPRASHFPQNAKGQYAGHHPADSAAAVSSLEAARAHGAAYLVIPSTAFWWLQHYKDFARHLDACYRVVVRQPDACVIYALMDDPARAAAEPPHGAYHNLPRQLSEVLRAVLPPKATIAVISKGDDRLTRLLPSGRGWHFPQGADGVYAGHYPADSDDAIRQLETVRQRGAEFFVLPVLAFWWLTHYREFGHYLEERYRVVVRQPHLGLVFDLRRPFHAEVSA